ncbi:MAG: hypothetical protein KGJ62_05890 [Armatimonadetes bacterium]|nr:hypothetical protein [Armatimonadota bacterium]MDE2206026.1 hypothetical protein [Armatimonadota bacterium]
MLKNREVPAWAIPAAIGVGVVLLIVMCYRALTGYNTPPGSFRPVHANMYNFHNEAMAGHIGNRHLKQQNNAQGSAPSGQ